MTLFALWGGGPYRSTRDLDLLGRGESSVQRLEQVFRDICTVQVEPDGLRFAAETVVAEKYQAMVMLGIANSRMRDFYDIWFLSRRFEFSGLLLSQAIKGTFTRL